ncbi:spermidine synthase [Herbiconiux sp. P18]|uniref:spermidine synthase n=1 Tax=Herbiconiux liangxiaofengii TaxID=3342795 RepID=UPI0035B6BD45
MPADDAVVARTVLRATGDEAVIRRDPLVPGTFELTIGGTAQSHVDLGDPANLFHDYVRRIGTVIDRFRMPGSPVTAVHLGAGALTLPRYVQATRPTSVQHVAELADDLVPFVLRSLPLPAGTRLHVHPGDAARTVSTLPQRRADLVVSDLYRGTTTPPHLRTPAFFRALAELLAPSGLLVVNVADDDGLPALRSQLAALEKAFSELIVFGPASVVTDARAGNAVIVASSAARPVGLAGLAAELRGAGPHPAAVVHSDDPAFAELR